MGTAGTDLAPFEEPLRHRGEHAGEHQIVEYEERVALAERDAKDPWDVRRADRTVRVGVQRLAACLGVREGRGG